MSTSFMGASWILILIGAGAADGAHGGNHAAARYFMMYLQENRRLVDFYTRFRDNFAKDKTGVRFAEEVLERKLG
jgi:hypothetical protein